MRGNVWGDGTALGPDCNGRYMTVLVDRHLQNFAL